MPVFLRVQQPSSRLESTAWLSSRTRYFLRLPGRHAQLSGHPMVLRKRLGYSALQYCCACDEYACVLGSWPGSSAYMKIVHQEIFSFLDVEHSDMYAFGCGWRW
jgi:hypothetical protein